MALTTLCTRALLVWGRSREQSWKASLAVDFPSCKRPASHTHSRKEVYVQHSVLHTLEISMQCISENFLFRHKEMVQ